MTEPEPHRPWRLGVSLGAGVGIGSAVARGVGGSFLVRTLIGSALAIAITLLVGRLLDAVVGRRGGKPGPPPLL